MPSCNSFIVAKKISFDTPLFWAKSFIIFNYIGGCCISRHRNNFRILSGKKSRLKEATRRRIALKKTLEGLNRLHMMNRNLNTSIKHRETLSFKIDPYSGLFFTAIPLTPAPIITSRVTSCNHMTQSNNLNVTRSLEDHGSATFSPVTALKISYSVFTSHCF